MLFRSDLGTARTPVDRFFVCNAGAAARVDAGAWRLRIDGDAAGAPVLLTFEQIAELPFVEVDAWLECAGNGRRLYEHAIDNALAVLEGRPATIVS